MQATSTTQGHLAWLAPEHHVAEEPPALLSALAMMLGTPHPRALWLASLWQEAAMEGCINPASLPT